MLRIRLFGHFSLQHGSAGLESLRFGKLAELFCYLLLHRERTHSREVLGALLWGESTTTAQSRKYLRQVFWQLNSVLDQESGRAAMLLVDRDSVRVNLESSTCLDVADFEQAIVPIQSVPPSQLTEAQAQALRNAVDLYRGDLLEGWYQEWCLIERERLQNLYLLALEKLMCYREEHREYQDGLEMGERILRLDRAHERTHQAMMRMYNFAGDRAQAIRQYQRCDLALREELGVGPAKSTLELLRHIRADQTTLISTADEQEPPVASELLLANHIGKLVAHLRRVLLLLSKTEARIEQEIQTLKKLQSEPCSPPAPRRANER